MIISKIVDEIKVSEPKKLGHTGFAHLFGDAKTQLPRLTALGFGEPILLHK